MDASDVIAALDLSRHPEGGVPGNVASALPKRCKSRGDGHLLPARRGGTVPWHRIDATEIWHFYAGDPSSSTLRRTAQPRANPAGRRLDRMELPQHVVPAGTWQAARPLGRWTLVGCTVTPAFEFSGFELAPPDWEPGPRAQRVK